MKFNGKVLEGTIVFLVPGIFDILVEEEPMVYKSIPAADVKKAKNDPEVCDEIGR